MDITEVVRQLRAQGREDAAQAVLVAIEHGSAAGAADFVPASDAATSLDLSINTIKRRVASGLLAGYKDPQNGYVYVNVQSVQDTLHLRESLRASAALPGAEPPRARDRRRELAETNNTK